MAEYFREAQKTATLLANASHEPLPFPERFAVVRQQVAENEAHEAYLGTKRTLYAALLDGYECTPLPIGT